MSDNDFSLLFNGFFCVSLSFSFVVLFLLAPTICIIKALAEIVKKDNTIAKATGKSVYL